MLNTKQVSYHSTNDPEKAKVMLSSLPDTIACDFEVAIRYTEDELKAMAAELETDISRRRKIELEQTLRATALDHPYHCTITHFSLGLSDHFSYVFICDNKEIIDVIYDFLVDTDVKQIWHNASYDFKHIYYNRQKFPKNYEDTQILAKTLVNHCDITQARTGLKELAGHVYGAWAIAADNFTLAQLHDEKVIHYAAIDSAATMWIWNNLQNRFKGVDDATYN